jgi:hypothetical protein
MPEAGRAFKLLFFKTTPGPGGSASECHQTTKTQQRVWLVLELFQIVEKEGISFKDLRQTQNSH